MIDTVQAVLLLVIGLLTILLIVLGIQVFLILRDVRASISKANRILDNAEVISESVSQPVTFISSLLSGSQSLSNLTSIIKLVLGNKASKKSRKE